MELTVLGSGSCIPYSRRRSSAYVIRVEDKFYMLDMGSGSTWRLVQNGFSYTKLNGIFITHFHPDHTGDLIPFLFGTRCTLDNPRVDPLYIIAPTGFKQVFQQLMNIYGQWIVTDQYELVVEELPLVNQHKFSHGNLEITICLTPHTDTSLAYKFSSPNGKTMVYTGDTGYSTQLVQLAQDADVLLTECSFPGELEVVGHLTPRLAGRIAREANVKKLVLSHFYPVCDKMDVKVSTMEEYDGEIIVAEDNMKLGW